MFWVSIPPKHETTTSILGFGRHEAAYEFEMETRHNECQVQNPVIGINFSNTVNGKIIVYKKIVNNKTIVYKNYQW